MKITILDDYLDSLRTLACFGKLHGHEVAVHRDHCEDEDMLVARLADSDVLVPIRERTTLPGSLLRRLPRLRLISLRSAYPHVDIDTCTQLGITVCSNVHAGTPSYAAAELTWGLILSATRRLPEQIASVKAGGWQTALGSTLRGKTLGIYGFGRIGATVAEYARAFGMRVVVLSRPENLSVARAAGFTAMPDRNAFFSGSDIVSVHLRLVGATRHCIGAGDFSLMKPTALFVNTSRAGLVVPGSLEASLRAGRPGVAAIDVYEREPVQQTCPFLEMPNVYCTPHIGFVTREEFELQFSDVFDQIISFAAGKLINLVNSQVLDRAR